MVRWRKLNGTYGNRILAGATKSDSNPSDVEGDASRLESINAIEADIPESYGDAAGSRDETALLMSVQMIE